MDCRIKSGNDDMLYVLRVLLVRPNGELVAVRIGEVKTPAAWKRELGLHDFRAGLFEALLRRGEILGVEDDEGPTRTGLAFCQAAGQPPVAELAIHRNVVLEGPTEGRVVEPARARDVADGELDVVDPAIVAWLGRDIPPISKRGGSSSAPVSGLHIGHRGSSQPVIDRLAEAAMRDRHDSDGGSDAP